MKLCHYVNKEVSSALTWDTTSVVHGPYRARLDMGASWASIAITYLQLLIAS